MTSDDLSDFRHRRAWTLIVHDLRKHPPAFHPAPFERAPDAWPGQTLGVRQPAPYERPLSWPEVHYAREVGLL